MRAAACAVRILQWQEAIYMREDDLTAGLVDVVRLNGLLADGAVLPEDAEAVLQALGAEGMAPAVSAMSRHAFLPRLSGKEASGRLGLPADGRPTRCVVYEIPAAEQGFAVVCFETETVRRTARALFAAQGERVDAGCPLPPEASMRLAEVAARPGLAGHLVRSAADHMAAHVEETLRELPGIAQAGPGRFLWTAAFPRGEEAAALAWLSAPGPGPFASSVTAFLPRETLS